MPINAIAVAALAVTPPTLEITSIAWEEGAPRADEFFLEMVASLDPSDREAVDMNAQTLAHFGRSDMIAAMSSFHRRNPCGASDDVTLSIDDLVGRAAATRLVIVNEAHVSPWHRATTTALLAPLRVAGYTHLAAETFNNSREGEDPVVANAALPYMLRIDGTYSSEPVFGEMVRNAKAHGYRFAAYEAFHEAADLALSRDESIARRETGQATNLAALLAADPEAKIVVHVGHSHVHEEPIVKENGASEEWMAKRLKDMTGIDPLTISQTVCTGEADGAMRIIPVGADHRGHIGTDLVIETSPDADYRVKPDGAIALRVPPSWRAGEGWTLVEAMRASEPDEAVAADHLVIHASDGDVKMLYLAPGRYRIRLRPLDPDNSPRIMMGPSGT